VARHQVARRGAPLVIAVVAAAVGACATQPTRYAWGSYEELIYTAQAKPGLLTPAAQAEQLEQDRQAAQAANRPLPPGWHAQLSFLYFQMGRVDLARRELLAEKTAFPESATLVDRLLANLAAPAATPR
jgi:hypothetical protein